MTDRATADLRFVTVHGKRRAFLMRGRGPAIVLLHGLACDHRTWLPVVDRLAEQYTVIAPDLLGHGLSDKPRADYTVGGYANGVRDLLTLLGIERATVVGHSFGGGIAMQFAYQFPERTERLMLVAAGGLGREVTALIKLIQAPGWGFAAAVLTLPGLRHVETRALRLAAALPAPFARHTRDLDEVAEIVESWKDRRTRFAIRHLVRAVVDWRGQVITMADRAYLTEAIPLAVVWGSGDRVIPAHHAVNVAALAPLARVEVLADSGHFPHKDHPERFAAILEEFMAVPAAVYDRARFRRLLERGRGEGCVAPDAVAPGATG